ncbi:MAG: hypothetical protein HQ514_03485 [Rhodospirillales bacterium]|nr:hypothetical protein [Rhodospirillales bacterium]
MTHSDQTIQNMFDTLQATYGAFHEDAPATALKAELVNETPFGDLPKIVQEAVALAA